MDAFAVAASVAVAVPQWTSRHTFRLAWHFGLFQGGMCLAGGLGGWLVSESVAQVDHWIVFGVLTFLGIRMIRESFQPKEVTSRFDPTRGWSLVVLSIATSIDALAVGVSLGLLGLSIWTPALIIGLVALGLTTAACHLGRLAGAYLGRWAERIGGLVLIVIGFRILYQHLL
jgi:putative Mn2+ efflux pump MntP